MQRRSVRAYAWMLFFSLYAHSVHPAEDQKPKEKEPPRDVVWERIETVYRFQNDGTGEIIQNVKLRVLTEAGLAASGQAYFAYSSQLEDLRIDYFRTIKKDGTQVSVDASKFFDVASPITQAAPVFSDLKMKGVASPNLTVGDAIELCADQLAQVRHRGRRLNQAYRERDRLMSRTKQPAAKLLHAVLAELQTLDQAFHQPPECNRDNPTVRRGMLKGPLLLERFSGPLLRDRL